MAFSPGQILNNRYRIIKLLGQGGFGAVYRAWDTVLERNCAVKENLDPRPGAERQFQREARILAGLDHSNLPDVKDYFVIPMQGQYLVMDFVEGEDLEELLAQAGGKLSEDQAVGWIEQVCSALEYLHSQTPPVIHRDIKPSNIKITPSGQVKLVDFGIAKVYDSAQGTYSGAQAATPGYSPFEQYGQEPTDARSDIYSLGATLYTLLTGQVPLESIARMKGKTLTIPRQINPAMAPHIEAAILKALELQPEQRFSQAREFREALTTDFFSHGKGGTVLIPTTSFPGVEATIRPSHPAALPRMWLLGGVLTLVVLVGIVIGLRSWIVRNPDESVATRTAMAGLSFTEYAQATWSEASVRTHAVAGETEVAETQKVKAGLNQPSPFPTIISPPIVIDTLQTSLTLPPTDLPELTKPISTDQVWSKNYVGSAESGGLVVEIARVVIGYKTALPDQPWDKLDKIISGLAETKVVGMLIFKITNNSSNTVNLFADQGSVQVGSEQINLFEYAVFATFGDRIGGEVFPGVTKIGGLYFGIKRSNPAQIARLVYRCSAPFGASFNSLGSDIEIVIEIPEHTWEDLPDELK